MIQMRDKNQSLLSFTDQIEHFIRKKLTSIEIFRTAVVNTPTFSCEYDLYLPIVNLRGIKGLSIIVHFVTNDNLKYALILYLEEKLKHFNLKQQLEIKILLTSKEICLKYLYLTDRYTSHEIFGNLVYFGIKNLKYLTIYKKKSKVLFPQRKRGYHDKGSLRPSDRWLPTFDSELTEMQNNKEKKSDLHEKTLNYLVNYLLRN